MTYKLKKCVNNCGISKTFISILVSCKVLV